MSNDSLIEDHFLPITFLGMIKDQPHPTISTRLELAQLSNINKQKWLSHGSQLRVHEYSLIHSQREEWEMFVCVYEFVYLFSSAILSYHEAELKPAELITFLLMNYTQALPGHCHCHCLTEDPSLCPTVMFPTLNMIAWLLTVAVGCHRY